MNTKLGPGQTLKLTKAFVRGSVVSIVDTERPVIETFTDGKTLMPFAFLRGIPIPYNTFIMFMALRFAPRQSRSMMPLNYENGEFQMDKEAHNWLINLWSLCELPPEFKSQIEIKKPWGANNLIRDLVAELYLKMQAGDDESAKKEFQTLIRRIDEEYMSSLIDPVQI